MTRSDRPKPRQRAVLAARQLVDVTPPRLSLALASAFEFRFGERELAFLPALVRPNAIAVDAGANRGVYARRLSRLCPRVVACEPQPHFASRLAAATPDNVLVLPVALSAVAGETTLRVPLVGSVAAHTRATLGPVGVGSHAEMTVLRLRLDDLGLGTVGFVKIDVEGHELDVLDGGAETIGRSRPRLLVECESITGTHPAKVAERLASLGYEGWFHYGGKILPVDDFQTDTHQATRKEIGGRRPSARATNFMFIPRGEAAGVLEAVRSIVAGR